MQEIKTNIVLIDDHTLFRSGLKFLLETQEDFEIIGEASDGIAGLKLIDKTQPDVVLMDLDMPVMGGREALGVILDKHPHLNIIILTVSEESDDLVECMRMGAKGYLLKNIDADFLLNSIRRTLQGDSVLSPEMTTKLITRLKRTNLHTASDCVYDSLTPREKETLVWLTKGVSNKEIARSLNLTESTVKVHVQNILKKLNLKSRVQAAVYALEHNLDKS
ncbi:Transcriptional regulatory protein DegU [Commensalibacter sp. Nvir]|uniref:response regulator transcription factor n=1 Tax=Commensalibacter sp. Nvir TaxID=3069817 RepID=UPI002D667E36|nr:Transcriptional regulatory protein DegU [Commensalibacter sp. Nvir]